MPKILMPKIQLVYMVEIDFTQENEDFLERLLKLADVTILSDIQKTLALWGHSGDVKTTAHIIV